MLSAALGLGAAGTASRTCAGGRAGGAATCLTRTSGARCTRTARGAALIVRDLLKLGEKLPIAVLFLFVVIDVILNVIISEYHMVKSVLII